MSSEAAAPEQVRDVLDDAIQHLIEDTIHDGGIIRTGPEVARLVRTHSNLGLLLSEVTARLVRAALKAGVAVAVPARRGAQSLIRSPSSSHSQL
jgi:hypothetical protein